jgi:hypothetical protein|nr:MAG TPA: hypothetical protein [Caudoviricetes sp.]
MIGRVNTGGGGSGGTLTVTAPANVTVTVSKDGKTKTKNSGTSGVVVFKGLKSGTWTVTITGDGKTAQKNVVVTTDYSTAIAFFAATINITYPAGSTCTCSDGTTTLSAPDTSGTWACIVPNAGTWTVSSTDGDKSKSADVVITTDGQTESVTLLYITYLFKDGETYDSLTGGWQGTVDAEKQALQLIVQAGKTQNVYTKSKVDMTDYSTISVKTDANVPGVSLSLIIEDSIAASKPVAKAELDTASDEVSLDISNITGSHFIRLYSYSEKGGSRYVYEVSMQ